MTRALTLCVVLAAPVPAFAQNTPTPPALSRVEAGSCARCTLKLEYVATVGSASDKELLKDMQNVMAVRGGGFVAYGDNGLMQLYDATGKYLRTVGRLGDGPGEYRNANALGNARGDSLLVYSYGRMSTISLSSGKGRTVQARPPLPAFRVLQLPDGSVMAQHYAGAPGAFVVMGPDAKVRASFGPIGDSVQYRTGRRGIDFDAQQFVITPSASGGFWAASTTYRPSLRRWSNDGKVLQTSTRAPSWFAPYSHEESTGSRPVGVVKPLPKVLGIWADAQEQVFVMAIVADSKWSPDPMASAPSRAEGAPVNQEPTGGYSRYLDGVIDVYDGKRGALIGSWRADEWPGMPLGEGLIGQRSQSEDGIWSYKVWRMVLSGR